MAYLRNKLTEGIPSLLAALLFSGLLAPAGDAIPVQTWTYEGICRELVAGTTEGRQALVGSLWHAPLPTLVGLPAAALLPRGAATPLVARTTIFMALVFLFWVLLRFCRRLFPPWTARGCWLACLLLLARLPELAIQPQQTVTLAAATAALLKLADWSEARRLSDLVKFAFALALLALCGAPLAGWTLLLALLLPAIAALDPALRPRFQGLLILGLLPTLYALGIWALMSRLILSDACYAWRFVIHGLVTWQGWPQNALHLQNIAPLACCALLGVLAATRRALRTALLGLAGVAVFAWVLLLHGLGFAWAADTAASLLVLIALLTLVAAGQAFEIRHPAVARCAATLAALLLLFVWVRAPLPGSPPLGTQNRQAQRTVLDAIERDVMSRTPYGRIFICGYRGLGLLEGEQRERFVASLDLHIGTLRERYRRQNLFLLVPRPEAEAALECTVWRYADIYSHGVERALFAGDWGGWRLYEIVTAPLEEQLDEWRR
jgi:hypothetical protein